MVKAQIAKGSFEPTFESLRKFECPDWFRDAKTRHMVALGRTICADVRGLVRPEHVL